MKGHGKKSFQKGAETVVRKQKEGEKKVTFASLAAKGRSQKRGEGQGKGHERKGSTSSKATHSKNYKGPMPERAKSAFIQKRKDILLPEYQNRYKTGIFQDRRFGEREEGGGGRDGSSMMSMEDKYYERYTRERLKQSQKKQTFRLEESESDDEEEGFLRKKKGEGELTHGGIPVNNMEEFSDPDDSEGEDPLLKGRIDKATVSSLHFSNFSDDESEEKPRTTKKTKGDVMKEVIAKSKYYKMERQKEKEEVEDMRKELDSMFPLLQMDLEADGRKGKKAEEENAKEHEFDELVKSLGKEGGKRAKASEKVKTEAELMEEEKERLEVLEAGRLARMSGQEGGNHHEGKDGVELNVDIKGIGRRKREKVSIEEVSKMIKEEKKKEKNENGTMEASTGSEVKGKVTTSEKRRGLLSGMDSILDGETLVNGESEDEIDSESEIESESESESETEADNETDDEMDDEECDNEGTDKDSEDGENEDSEDSDDSDNDDDDDEFGSIDQLQTSSSASLLTLSSFNIPTASFQDVSELPYSFPSPTNSTELYSFLQQGNISLASLSILFNRYKTLYHISLNEENRNLQEIFIVLLLKHITSIASDSFGSLKEKESYIDCMMSFIEDLLVTSVCKWKGYAHTNYFDDPEMDKEAEEKRNNQLQFLYTYFVTDLLKSHLSSYHAQLSVSWPTPSFMFSCMLVGRLFSTSDYRHKIVTPYTSLLAMWLAQAPLQTMKDAWNALGVCHLYLHYQRASYRYCPEVWSCLSLFIDQLFLEDQSVHTCYYLERSIPFNLSLWKDGKTNLVKKESLLKYLHCASYVKTRDYEELEGLLSIESKVAFAMACLDNLESSIQHMESSGLPSLPELLRPLLSSMQSITLKNLKSLPEFLKDRLTQLKNSIESLLDSSVNNRNPLQLASQHTKPKSISTMAPRIDERYLPSSLRSSSSFSGQKRKGIDFGREKDREESEHKKLKAAYKREWKSARKELRGDNRFLSVVKKDEWTKKRGERKGKGGIISLRE